MTNKEKAMWTLFPQAQAAHLTVSAQPGRGWAGPLRPSPQPPPVHKPDGPAEAQPRDSACPPGGVRAPRVRSFGKASPRPHSPPRKAHPEDAASEPSAGRSVTNQASMHSDALASPGETAPRLQEWVVDDEPAYRWVSRWGDRSPRGCRPTSGNSNGWLPHSESMLHPLTADADNRS